jgi:hypothetical protein
MELTRFLGLVPLAFKEFRTAISPAVAASDAPEPGGGATCSSGVTVLGVITSNCSVRRDLIDPVEVTSVLTAGLF